MRIVRKRFNVSGSCQELDFTAVALSVFIHVVILKVSKLLYTRNKMLTHELSAIRSVTSILAFIFCSNAVGTVQLSRNHTG